MKDFLEQISWAFCNSVSEKLKVLCREKKEIAIVGMHAYGVGIAKNLVQQELHVSCFVDMEEKVSEGAFFAGLPVFPIEEVIQRNMVCVLCNGYDAQGKLEMTLSNKKVDYISFQYIDKNRYGNHHEAAPIYTALDTCYQAYAKLSDHLSKKTYVQLIKYRLTRDPVLLEVSPYPQYFHPLVRPRVGDIVLEAGGCDGRTAIEIADYLKGKGKVFSFEPDAANYHQMLENLKSCRYGSCVIPVNKGLWKEEARLNFQADSGGSSKVDQDGKGNIDVIDIDAFVKEQNISVDLIKLDVEGSEKDVLEGARKTIALYQPKLQISVYHYEGDLWNLLLYIYNLNPFYKFYLGQHTRSITETILYAYI